MPIEKVIIISDKKDEPGCLPMAFGGIAFFVFVLYVVGQMINPSPRTPEAPGFVPVVPRAEPAPRLVPRFVALQPRQYPSPSPEPVFLGRHPTNGGPVFGWQGRRWILPPRPSNPYTYLCVVGGGLHWCWPTPPHPQARLCTDGSSPLRTPGWCWDEKQF